MDPNVFVRKLEESFLEIQTDEWLVQLYTFLSEQPGLNNIIKGKPILRLEDNSHVSPFKRSSPYDRNEAPNAYLLREGKSKFRLVKRSLLTDDTVYAFLKRIGLSEPDIVQERKMVSLPSSLTNDPDRRREKAAEAAYNSPVKIYKAVSINRRISAGNSEPKTYLRSHHTNAEGQLIALPHIW